MSDFETPIGFQSCWHTYRRPRSVRSAASGHFSTKSWSGGVRAISGVDKGRLDRVTRRVPEVMVKVTRPARTDKQGNAIHVSRGSEGVRVAGHFDYISRNGKVVLETEQGEELTGQRAVAALREQWLRDHDEDRANRMASERTRITTGLVLSMPADVNATALKEAARAFAQQEFGGRHDYVLALHTDTKHPHVHLTLRTVGHDGQKLNLRKADLQHLRDVFAQRLRQRGIEAESTPRHARGVTKRGEKIAFRKMREREVEPHMVSAQRRAAERDIRDYGGRGPAHDWDGAILERRKRVVQTYARATVALAQSPDVAEQALAGRTDRFMSGLTQVFTRRYDYGQEIVREDAARRSADRADPRKSVDDLLSRYRQEKAVREWNDKDRGRNKDNPDKDRSR